MDLNRRVAYGLMNVPANALSQDGVELTDMRVMKTTDGWLVMLKGTRRGKDLVTFFHEGTFQDALRQMTTSLDSRHAGWRIEKPPPWQK